MTSLALALALIQLVGRGELPGDASDGMTDDPVILEDGTPIDRLGAFGSALTYTGIGSRYVAVPDRGPADGATSWPNRFYVLDIQLDVGASVPLRLSFVRSVPLTNEDCRAFIGLSAAFDATVVPSSRRLDPEGARMSPRGSFYVSDEYGPSVYEFARNGARIGVVTVPDSFGVMHPGATEAAELPPHNTAGRQPNRGMEGLAISPDGMTLFGILQSPLIQDHGLDPLNKRRGTPVRARAAVTVW